MNYTNDQLKQALAKMLPDEVFFGGESDQESTLRWNNTLGLKVANTEMLHLCWMVEETFDDGIPVCKYVDSLVEIVGTENYFSLIHATWQQRVIALCKVKGIEI